MLTFQFLKPLKMLATEFYAVIGDETKTVAIIRRNGFLDDEANVALCRCYGGEMKEARSCQTCVIYEFLLIIILIIILLIIFLFTETNFEKLHFQS